MAETILRCETKPEYEFVISDKRPEKVGIRSNKGIATAWYSKGFTLKLILKAKREIDFYTEVLNLFKGVKP